MSIVAADQVTPQWQNYVDLTNDVKPFLQFPVGSNPADAQLQMFIDMACTWVQTYLGRPVAPTTIFRRFSGWSGLNGAFITLPYYPVLQIVSLVEWWGLNGEHSLVYQTPANQGGPGQEMYQVDWINGILVRTYQGLIQRPFFPGTGNVECEWMAGYNPVPADLKFATLKLIKHAWNCEQQASRPAAGPVPVGSVGEHLPSAGIFAGLPPEIEHYLSPYVQQGIG